MRLLTYNIHFWEGTDGVTDVERTLAVIAASGADIVGLNEVYHPSRFQGLDRPALEHMAARLGMHFAFGQAQTFPLAFNRPGRSFGNAILSRWPILASAAHHLTPVEGHPPRGLLEARILLPDGQRTLTVYVTHLDAESEDVRLIQTQSLLSWTGRDRARPHVLMGDFNAYSPADYPTPADLENLRRTVEALGLSLYEPQVVPRLLRAGYTDAWAVCGEGPGATCCNEPEPLFRIDYVFVSQPLVAALRRCRRWDAEPALVASDHLPVLVELEW
ncbi:MAG: endonuclease/exonuclease/phosphatase family protein [Anaerolineae bacterium]|nr:endonuclease/exonuclease/phosphatase family protein [Caldilineales bacterium]MDW8269141.1 endonuclease/exonuclease/phosphatase family protein [Anaerolineae bacterium]